MMQATGAFGFNVGMFGTAIDIGSTIGSHSGNERMKTRATTRHYLLPHERRLASFMLERQRTHRTAAIRRMEQNLGPEGMALQSAALANYYPGAIIGIVGFVPLWVGNGTVFTIGSYFTLVAVILCTCAFVQGLQCLRAARAFRGDRPFVRR